MVGLSDIPCVGKIVDRISDATVDPLFRGLNYMFCYKGFVNNLNSEIEKLTNQEGRLSIKANAEKNNGKRLHADVLKWQTDVEEFQRSATEFSEKYKSRASWRCIHCLPIPKPVSRFRLGREAAQKVKRVTELSKSGTDLLASEIAYLPPVENIPKTDTVFQKFESREGAYKKLWEELETEGSSSILGIYGMPGVGKTRMMEQLWKEAKEKKIFDKVARADVGGDALDVIKLVIKLQNQIAGHLGCKFESQDNLESRASQLKNSLMNAGKVLVILDDVWSEIPLGVIGIPSVDDSSCKGLKILLTSRKEDVCLKNNCKHPIKIKTLTDDEAWDLFRNTVGSMPDISIAHEVCNKCKGLPLLIHAVGKALQYTSDNSWEDALGQLEKGTVGNIDGIDRQVYACVQLSIDRLQDDAKSCLFLCSLYPEDAVIYMRKLIQIATGSQLVLGKSRVCAMVDNLRSSSLLLDCEEDDMLKLHDLIRDVARSIAVRDPKYAFLLVRCGGSRLPHNPDYRTRKLLYLHVEKNELRFSDGLECPELHTLWLHCNNHILKLSGGFFSMFENLGFLLIEGMSYSLELQFSLQSLGKLRTLILDECDLTHANQTNVGLFPENLEILCFWNCSLPLPLDLRNLKDLRKLEIKRPQERPQLFPNTISSLPNLEELHMHGGYNIHDDGSEQSSNASILMEISRLTGLKSLQMTFKNSEPFQDTNIFDNLLEYNISVSWETRFFLNPIPSVSIKRCIFLSHTKLEGLESLIERAEEASFNNIDISVISNRKAFSDLKNLVIVECMTMEYLARISQDEIYNIYQPLTSFSKLTRLEIMGCSGLIYLFSKSVAKGLKQLQYLTIEGCRLIEAIIMNEDTDDGDIINFSKLKSLTLNDMPRLKSFYREKEDMHASSTSVMDNSAILWVQSKQPFFNGMVAFPSLEYLETRKLANAVCNLWGEYYYSVSSFCKLKSLNVVQMDKLETVIPPSMLNRMPNLETINLGYCNILRNVFPPSIARDLVHLKSLQVVGCGRMREIIGRGGRMRKIIGRGGRMREIIGRGGRIVFPELTSLKLVNLPNLTSFWCHLSGEDNNYKVEFPNLVDLYLWGVKISLGAKELGIGDFTCQRLEVLKVGYCGYSTALALSVFRSLQQIRYLKISDSEILKEIVEGEAVRGDEASDMDKKTITLLQLKEITLENLPHIKSVMLNSNYECHMPALTKVKVYNCGISTLFTFSALRSLPQLQELEISNCSILEEIVEGVRGDEASGVDKKTITLFQLRSVTLTNLPNLRSLIRNANYECHMPALKEVRIDTCGLDTLFTCSVSRKLHQLEKLDVRECRSLESIVDDVGDDETSFTDDKIITFPRLKKVYLSRMPNLKYFSSTSNYAFSMPKLSHFEMNSCPRIKYFTLLKTSTPVVSVWCTDWGIWGTRVPDLNDCIRQDCKSRSSSSDSVGESSCSVEELETESEGVEELETESDGVEEGKPQEDIKE